MRIFTILLIIVVSISSSNGQALDQPVKKPAKVKPYNLARPGRFNTWDIGGSFGITYPYTDISASSTRNYAIAIDGTKFLTHTFALQMRFIHASLSGIDINKPEYRFNTTINYDISLNGIFQFGNISFLKRNPDLAFYASLGVGLIHYSPTVYIDGGNVAKQGIYSQYSQPLVEMDYQPTTDLVIPIGIGVKYHLSKKYSITGEYCYRTTNSDKLDGFYKLLSASDKFSFFGVGVTYHIGNQSKDLEWVNPLQTVYNDLYSMKAKIDLLIKDTDLDGVPDLYDREPNTEAGSKVYGDGSAVDSDMDSIPDINDFEPFSEKNAKVDPFGRTINKYAKSIIPVDSSVKEIENKSDSQSNGYVNVPVTRIENEKENLNVTLPKTVIDNKMNADSNATKTLKADEMPSNPIKLNPAIPNTDSINKLNPESKSLYENYADVPSVYFASEESKITAKHFKTLDYIAQVLKNNPSINYNIIGICDNSGNLQYNLDLSKRRAESVKRYLEKNFNIDPNRLSISTIGTYEMINGNNQMNRRVDFQIRN